MKKAKGGAQADMAAAVGRLMGERVDDKTLAGELEELGLEPVWASAVALALVRKAGLKADTAAAKFVRELAGEGTAPQSQPSCDSPPDKGGFGGGRPPAGGDTSSVSPSGCHLPIKGQAWAERLREMSDGELEELAGWGEANEELGMRN